ncbi:site-specific integrase [Chitinophaga lutea]|uniref:Site-specific integrase n=1 Tax=Chitinophaga lutea TaxID=2488634 RepID=A0A3N4PCK2_9BACT|nr:site-specific integrase [Chitinophaga lutea]RPE05795.1 site-specific integrase [Chitinophaga lutea]
MELNTFKVQLVLKTNKTNKKGLVPIFAKIFLNGQKAEISTNRSIDPQQWMNSKQCAKTSSPFNKELNQFLESFKTKIYQTYSRLQIADVTLSILSLKEALNGNRIDRQKGLIAVTEEHNHQFEKLVGIKFSFGSYKNYKTTLSYLKEFVPAFCAIKDIPLLEVNYKFCEAYYTFLTTEKPCTSNGANKHIQRLKKIINYALRAGYIKSNPTATFSLQFKPVEKQVLSWEEIIKIKNLPISRSVIDQVRDVFIFQCFTGLAYSDVKRLRPADIQPMQEGELWIKMRRQKTNISFSIPLLEPALDVLGKYLNDGEKYSPVFPVLSNQKMNDYLKVIQELAGISKNLTTHLARHSFATSVALNNGVPIDTVSKMLGHTNLKTTQVYAKVMDSKIAKDMQELKVKLSGNLKTESNE